MWLVAISAKNQTFEEDSKKKKKRVGHDGLFVSLGLMGLSFFSLFLIIVL